MTVTNTALGIIAVNFGTGGSLIPTCFGIGSGSGATPSTADISGLRNEYADKRLVFTSIDTGTAKRIVWTGDWSSVTMSGLKLREVGIFNDLSGGSLFDHSQSSSQITFDGTNELRVELTWNFY